VRDKISINYNTKSPLGFRLVPNSVTLNDLERRNSRYLAWDFILVINTNLYVPLSSYCTVLVKLSLLTRVLLVNILGNPSENRHNSYTAFRLVSKSKTLKGVITADARYLCGN